MNEPDKLAESAESVATDHEADESATAEWQMDVVEFNNNGCLINGN